MPYTAQQAQAAVKAHGTIFFDHALNPITPEAGEWFCEFSDGFDDGESEELRDEELVRYEGKDERHTLDGDKWVTVMRDMVSVEYADEWREPNGVILVSQNRH